MDHCLSCGKETQGESLCGKCSRNLGFEDSKAPTSSKAPERRCCAAFDEAFMLGAPIKHDDDCPMAARDKRDEEFVAWTLVQHHLSHTEFCLGYGWTAEVAEVRNSYVAQDILDKGGLIFDTREEAEAVCQKENFPEFHEGANAHVEGTFPNHQEGGRSVEVTVYDKSKRGRKACCLVYIPWHNEDGMQ